MSVSHEGLNAISEAFPPPTEIKLTEEKVIFGIPGKM